MTNATELTLTRRCLLGWGSAAIAWQAFGGGTAAAAAMPLSVAIASRNFGAMAALATAEKAGLFNKQQLAPTFTTMNNGSTAMAAMLGGSANFCVVGPAEVFAATLHGQDVVLVANLYRGLSGSLVLSRSAAEASGVAADAPIQSRLRALDGLVVAVPSATSSLLGPLKAVADDMKINVRFTYIGQTEMPSSLAAGAIQGMMASSPVWTRPITDGTGVLWINGPKGELPDAVLPRMSGVLATTRAFAIANPQVVAGVVSVLTSLANLVQSDPAAARQDFADAYPEIPHDLAAQLFDGESYNFTQPRISADDVTHDQSLMLRLGAGIEGLAAITPSQVLLPD